MALVYLIGKWQGRDFFADYGWIIADWQFFTIKLENCKSVKTTLLQYYFVNLYIQGGTIKNKKNIYTPDNEQRMFPNLKSYPIDEILAAGGPEAFSAKMGKNAEKLFDTLKNLSKDTFLTDEEFDAAMKTLNASK